jgi:hypothetical protein
MFNALIQSLFKKASHSAAGISLTTSKLTQHATLSRARGPSGLTERDEVLLRDIPIDIRTIYKAFDLDPEVTIFAACTRPTCCATYAPTLDRLSGIRQYPLRCVRAKFGQVCGSPLIRQHVAKGLSVPSPLRPFVYHHFNDHVASMLSQPGIEEAIRLHLRSVALERELHDIIASPALAELRDPSGLPFLRDCGDELRLVWSIWVDWYNPHGNKAAGKSVSTGVIAMTCLSLPPDLRTLEGNIYVAGMIPPPEPSLDAINHFLYPIIYDMQVAYDPGIHFSQTNDYPTGRTVRSAVIPAIADTMASKKITGHCGHRGTYFCSRCRLRRFEIDNLDMATWPPGLTRSEHEKFAEDWLTAPTKAKQDSLVKANGIRWSPFLKLQYWQPSTWIIPDGMHVILLGLIARHIRDLLGLSIKDLPDQDEDIPPKVMRQARRILNRRSKTALKTLKMNVLKALCCEQGVLVTPPAAQHRRKKCDYIAALLVSFKTEDCIFTH